MRPGSRPRVGARAADPRISAGIGVLRHPRVGAGIARLQPRVGQRAGDRPHPRIGVRASELRGPRITTGIGAPRHPRVGAGITRLHPRVGMGTRPLRGPRGLTALSGLALFALELYARREGSRNRFEFAATY